MPSQFPWSPPGPGHPTQPGSQRRNKGGKDSSRGAQPIPSVLRSVPQSQADGAGGASGARAFVSWAPGQAQVIHHTEGPHLNSNREGGRPGCPAGGELSPPGGAHRPEGHSGLALLGFPRDPRESCHLPQEDGSLAGSEPSAVPRGLLVWQGRGRLRQRITRLIASQKSLTQIRWPSCRAPSLIGARGEGDRKVPAKC